MNSLTEIVGGSFDFKIESFRFQVSGFKLEVQLETLNLKPETSLLMAQSIQSFRLCVCIARRRDLCLRLGRLRTDPVLLKALAPPLQPSWVLQHSGARR